MRKITLNEELYRISQMMGVKPKLIFEQEVEIPGLKAPEALDFIVGKGKGKVGTEVDVEAAKEFADNIDFKTDTELKGKIDKIYKDSSLDPEAKYEAMKSELLGSPEFIENLKTRIESELMGAKNAELEQLVAEKIVKGETSIDFKLMKDIWNEIPDGPNKAQQFKNYILENTNLKEPEINIIVKVLRGEIKVDVAPEPPAPEPPKPEPEEEVTGDDDSMTEEDFEGEPDGSEPEPEGETEAERQAREQAEAQRRAEAQKQADELLEKLKQTEPENITERQLYQYFVKQIKAMGRAVKLNGVGKMKLAKQLASELKSSAEQLPQEIKEKWDDIGYEKQKALVEAMAAKLKNADLANGQKVKDWWGKKWDSFTEKLTDASTPGKIWILWKFGMYPAGLIKAATLIANWENYSQDKVLLKNMFKDAALTVFWPADVALNIFGADIFKDDKYKQSGVSGVVQGTSGVSGVISTPGSYPNTKDGFADWLKKENTPFDKTQLWQDPSDATKWKIKPGGIFTYVHNGTTFEFKTP